MNSKKLNFAALFPMSRIVDWSKNIFALVGVLAVVVTIYQSGQTSGNSHRIMRGDFVQVDAESGRREPVPLTASEQRSRLLAAFISKRYRVANDPTQEVVEAAYEAGSRTGLDPLLLLAVMAVESRFNPIAESVFGAKGLMQVMPQFHRDKLEEHGGVEAVLDPATNILVGARILKDCVARAGGLEAGLQLYAGAYGESGVQYAQKVMTERERIDQAVKSFQIRDQRARELASSTGPS